MPGRMGRRREVKRSAYRIHVDQLRRGQVSHPLVSVIIPIYNAERYLADTLNSVFAQTFQDYEVICVNDGSTDGSGRVLEQFAEKVRTINQTNCGQTVAQNRGAQEARGRLLAFLDADDIWYPHKLAMQIGAIEANPQAIMVNCDYDEIDSRGTPLRQGVASAYRLRVDEKEPLISLLGLAWEIPSFMLIHREAFEQIGGFDPVLTAWDSDYDLCVRLRDLGAFHFIEMSGGAKRIHPASHTHSNQFRKKKLQCRVFFLEKLQSRFAEDPGKRKIARGILSRRYADLGWHESCFGDWREGVRFLMSSLRTNPWRLRIYSRLGYTLLRQGLKQLSLRTDSLLSKDS